MTVTDAAQPILLQSDPDFWASRDDGASASRMRRGAIIAAALCHAAVIAALLLHWPVSFAKRPPIEKPPIRVALVPAVPRKPPPPPKPAPPRVMHELRSGPDQVTTAPPPVETKGPKAAPKPQPERQKPAVEGLQKPQPKPPAIPPPKPKVAAHETAPKLSEHRSLDLSIGNTLKEGNPYLNRMWALIESHRFYPANAVGPLGLRLAGTVVYDIFVSPSGVLENMRLAQSSGAPVLDEAARKMIEEAAPFPPLPPYFPRDGVTLSVRIHIFPNGP